MNAAGYSMSFGEWCNSTKGTALKLTKYGEIEWNDPGKSDAVAQYHDLWMAERREYTLREKNERITHALQSLKNEGIKCRLCDYQNGHIQAFTRHGIKLSYYATTGTIAGYKDTFVEGLEEFIRLCKR